MRDAILAIPKKWIQLSGRIQMLILGIFSLLQITALPGLITLRLIQFRGTFWQRVLYTFALSLLINYCLVSLLAPLHLYARPIVLTLFAAQAIYAVWLYRSDLRRPLLEISQTLWDQGRLAIAGLFHSTDDAQSNSKDLVHLVLLLLTLISLIIAADRIWWAAGIYFHNLGSVFDAWDAVFSWNRWAGVWFDGRIPTDTRFYPQLIPVNWSLTYVFIGDSNLQLFAKSIMPLFILGIFLQLFDLGISLRQTGFFIAIILLRAMFVRFTEAEIYNGYVDITVAFFGLLPIYTIARAQKTKLDTERHTLWILGFFFAAAATVTKQAGVYIFILYPFLVYILLLRPKYGSQLTPTVWRDVLTWGASAALIPLTWYGLKLITIYQGADVSEIMGNANTSAQVYGNVGLASQVIHALQHFGTYLILFPLIFFLLPLLPSLVRWLFFLFILPFPVLWAVLASYDFRNLTIFFPIFALASGLALEAIFLVSLRLLKKASIEKWMFALIPLASLVFLFILGFLYPTSHIRTVDKTARQEVFSPSLNRELQHLFSDNPNLMILTNYPVGYILEHEKSQITFWYTDPGEFERLMQNKKITHLLVPTTGVHAVIKDQIEQWVNEGRLTFVMQDKGSSVIPYRLYKINQ